MRINGSGSEMSGRKAALNESVQRLIFNGILTVLAYMGFYRFGFGSDTITHYLWPMINIDAKITYGRYLTFLIEYPLYRAGIVMPDYYRLFYLLFLADVILALTVLQSAVLPAVKPYCRKWDAATQYLVCAMLSLPLINSLFTEYFMFPECFDYGLSFLIAAAALYFLCRRRWGLAVLFTLVSCLSYQTAVILVAMYGVVYFALESRMQPDRRLIGSAAGAVLIPLVIGFADTKFSSVLYAMGITEDKPKSMEIGNLADRIKFLLGGIRRFLHNGFGLLPVPWTTLLVVIVCICLSVYICLRSGKKIEALMVLAVDIVCAGLSVGIPVLQSFAPRISFLMYGAVGISILMLYVVLQRFGGEEGFEKENSGEESHGEKNTSAESILYRLPAALTAAVLILQIFSCAQISVNHYLSNGLDVAYTRMVWDEIQKYEAETGNVVRKIATCQDANCRPQYDTVYYSTDQINERAMAIVAYSLLEYTADEYSETGHDYERKFEKIDFPDSIYREHFAGRDWDDMDIDEQLIFDGDTMYWCVF